MDRKVCGRHHVAELRKLDAGNEDFRHGGFHLIDGGEIGQDVGQQFERRERLFLLAGRDRLKFGLAREIEQPAGEPLLVEAVENDRQA